MVWLAYFHERNDFGENDKLFFLCHLVFWQLIWIRVRFWNSRDLRTPTEPLFKRSGVWLVWQDGRAAVTWLSFNTTTATKSQGPLLPPKGCLTVGSIWSRDAFAISQVCSYREEDNITKLTSCSPDVVFTQRTSQSGHPRSFFVQSWESPKRLRKRGGT